MLVGDDETEKAAVAAEFAEMVDEGLRAFNVDRLFGADMDVDDLIHAAAMLPMMVSRRVVLVLEADKLLIPKRESKAAEEEQQRLERFVEDPPTHATIVFVCGPLDQRRRVVKLLMKKAQIVDCGTIGDEADAERWVKVRAAKLGAPLDAGAVRVLVQRAGRDIVRLRAGLERLALYAMGQTSIGVGGAGGPDRLRDRKSHFAARRGRRPARAAPGARRRMASHRRDGTAARRG
jgi:DNA polymerase III delta subunit